jgi:glycosyltransferase involved in cell wall biosynthesis
MKILHTPARFYPYVGGVEKYVLTISQELVQRGHDVTVICANEPEGKTIDYYEGIRVKRLCQIGKIANTNITPVLPFELTRGHYDIIHTHIPTPWSADCSSVVSRIKNVPLIVTYHNDIGGRWIYNSLASFYNRTMLHLVLKQASSIIITSSNFRTPCLARYREKVKIIPNSVDTRVFRPVSRQMAGDIFFLGVLDTYHQYKGLEILFTAIFAVKKEIPDIKLIIGGSGPMKEYYARLSRSMGITENVEFAGYIPDNKLSDYYNSCRMVVLPSIDPTREGFGIVLLEAMACGRPVISTDISGVAEDIRIYGAGIVVEPGNADVLVEAIKTIRNDPNLANRMGSAGRVLIEEKYGSENVAGQIEEIYREAVR